MRQPVALDTIPLPTAPADAEGSVPVQHPPRVSHEVIDTQAVRTTSMRGSERQRVITGHTGDEPLYFIAERVENGNYMVTLTEDGVDRLETALGIAGDLGAATTISSRSTIADIMDRTATRDELSRTLRRGDSHPVHRARVAVLKRRLRGSERPSTAQRVAGHAGKALIVGLIGLWSLRQFGIALGDIESIPGILGNIPNDILNLQPAQAFSDVGAAINDAFAHVLIGVLGCLLTYLVAKLLKPFARMYRRDQVVPGERTAVGFLTWLLRRTDDARRARSSSLSTRSI